jgi:hypothetical protein
MGLWDGQRGDKTALEEAFRDFTPLSPEEFAKAWADHLVTNCEHGTLRTEHCPWCYVQTAAYRQALADAMRTVLGSKQD